MATHPDFQSSQKSSQQWAKRYQSTLLTQLKWLIKVIWFPISLLICFPIVAIALYYAFTEWYDKIHY